MIRMPGTGTLDAPLHGQSASWCEFDALLAQHFASHVGGRLTDDQNDMVGHGMWLRSIVSGKEVVELGVRDGLSTCYMLSGRPRHMRSIDIRPCSNRENIEQALRDIYPDRPIPWMFERGSSLEVLPSSAHVLFIDTLHTYKQLSQELARWASFALERIVMHDTRTYGLKGEDGTEPGLRAAIREFLASHGEWVCEYDFENSHGLTVLTRR